jgi:hypothetical protein
LQIDADVRRAAGSQTVKHRDATTGGLGALEEAGGQAATEVGVGHPLPAPEVPQLNK